MTIYNSFSNSFEDGGLAPQTNASINRKTGSIPKATETELVAPRKRGRKPSLNRVVMETQTKGRARKRIAEILVGERIRKLRSDARLSQEELARASQMSTSYISRLESGEVNPTVDALFRIVRVFGLSIDNLLEMEQQSVTPSTAEEIDPEVRVLLFKLKGRKITERTRRLLQVVIEEELKQSEV